MTAIELKVNLCDGVSVVIRPVSLLLGPQSVARRSAIIVTDGMKDIQGLSTGGARLTTMLDTPRDLPHLAWSHQTPLSADLELQLALQQQAHLFVWMSVRLNDGEGFKCDQGKHHALPSQGVDIHARENRMLRALLTRKNIPRHATAPLDEVSQLHDARRYRFAFCETTSGKDWFC